MSIVNKAPEHKRLHSDLDPTTNITILFVLLKLKAPLRKERVVSQQFQYIQIYTSYNRHEENNNFRMRTSEIKRKELHSVGFYIIQDEKSPYRDIVKNEKVGFVLLGGKRG